MQLAELLEPRCLLAVTPILVNSTELLVQLEAGDNVTIQADTNGNLEVLSRRNRRTRVRVLDGTMIRRWG